LDQQIQQVGEHLIPMRLRMIERALEIDVLGALRIEALLCTQQKEAHQFVVVAKAQASLAY